MKKTDKHSRLEQYAPPGINLTREILAYIFCICCAVGYSFGFLFSYIDARNQLYEKKWRDGPYELIEGAQIPPFEDLVGNYFHGFILVGVVIVAMLLYHYFYHYQDSKMIYLMKRLPDTLEWHKRCVALPIAGVLVAVAVYGLLWMGYLGIYLIFTPQQCLPF
ncbi:MAG: hypothetical protein ACI4TK_09155 [Agathobacter sp.]